MSGGECNWATSVGPKRRHRTGRSGTIFKELVHDGPDMAPVVLKAAQPPCTSGDRRLTNSPRVFSPFWLAVVYLIIWHSLYLLLVVRRCCTYRLFRQLTCSEVDKAGVRVHCIDVACCQHQLGCQWYCLDAVFLLEAASPNSCWASFSGQSFDPTGKLHANSLGCSLLLHAEPQSEAVDGRFRHRGRDDALSLRR
jgi:hypothetical protein